MKIFGYSLIFLALVSIIYFTKHSPHTLAYNNFLDSFIGVEILALFSVIVTITFASVENIHLYLCKMEGDLGKAGCFKNTRSEVNKNIYAMVVMLLISIITLIIKGGEASTVCLSIIHGTHLLILLTYIIILLDIYSLITKMAELLSSQ